MFRIDLEREMDRRDKKGNGMRVKMVSGYQESLRLTSIERARRGEQAVEEFRCKAASKWRE